MQFPSQIVAQFAKDDTQMIEIGAKALRANGISFVLFGFHTMYSLLFLTLGKGKEGFILGAYRLGICFIPLIFILSIIMEINWILFTQSISALLSVIVTILMAILLHQRLKEMQNLMTS